MRRFWLALVLVVACSSSNEDVAAFRRAIEADSGPIRDEAAFNRLVEAVRDNCDLDDDAFTLGRAMARDAGNFESWERGVRYFCPERLNEQ